MTTQSRASNVLKQRIAFLQTLSLRSTSDGLRWTATRLRINLDARFYKKKDGTLHSVSYWFYSPNHTEHTYAATERKCYGTVWMTTLVCP